MSVKAIKNTPKKTKRKKSKEIVIDDIFKKNENSIENTLEKVSSTNETLKKSFLKHLEMTFNVSESLKRAGLSSKKYNLFLEHDEIFNQSVQDLTNSLIDYGQSKLLQFVKIDPMYVDSDGIPHKHPLANECLKATQFLLDRLGASRGWNGEPIQNKQKIDNKIEVYIHSATPEMTQEIIDAQN